MHLNGNIYSDEALKDEVYGRLRTWQEGCRPIHQRAREARQILLLQDPLQDEGRERDRPTLQLETLRSTFNNCVADQMDNLPEALLLPERAELQPVAEDLADTVRHVLTVNHFEALHRRRAEDCFCTGTAVTQVVWDGDMDGGRGNVALIRWPIEAFLWDPAAETLQEARAVFKVSRHPLSWFEAHYPGKQVGAEDGTFADLGIGGTDSLCGGDEEKALLIEYWYRTYDAQSRRHQIHCAYLAGGTVLAHYRNVYRHGMYPFVLDVYSPLEGCPAGEGLVQELAPLMRYINRYASYIDMNLRMSSKGRLLVDRSAGLEKEQLTDWMSDVVEGDRIDASAVKWLQSQPYTGLAGQQMLQFQCDLKQDSGQNQFSRGETVGGVTAASAISALQEAGGKITRLRTASLNDGFRAMVEQILWLIAQFYGEKRVLFLTGRTVAASPERFFGKGELPPMPYTVQVQVQRRNPLRQQAQNELLLQAFDLCQKSGTPMPVSTLFQLLQADGKERILPALQAAEALPRAVNQMAGENQELRTLCDEAGALMQESTARESALQETINELLAEREELMQKVEALEAKNRQEMVTSDAHEEEKQN